MTNKTTELPLVIPITTRPDSKTLLSYAQNVFYEKSVTGQIKAYKRPAFRWRPYDTTPAALGTPLLQFYSDPADYQYILIKLGSGELDLRTAYYDTVTPDLELTAQLATSSGASGITGSYEIRRVFTNASGDGIWLVGSQSSTAAHSAYWDDSGSTLTLITDTDYKGINNGLVIIDGYAFVVDPTKDHIIHNNEGTLATWDATNIIYPVYGSEIRRIEYHHDHVACFTNKGIEFFYNNRNADGSVLSPRDVDNIPIVIESTSIYNITRDNSTDTIYFVGKDSQGAAGIYRLENFQAVKVSTGDIDTLLNFVGDSGTISPSIQINQITLRGTKHIIVGVTYSGDDYTLVYNTDLNVWVTWTADASIFPAGFNAPVYPVNLKSASSTTAQFIVRNQTGEYLIDTTAHQDLNSSSVAKDIDVVLAYPNFIGEGTDDPTALKYGNFFKIVADDQATAQTATVSWSNDDYATYTSGRSLTLGYDKKLPQLGSWRERAFKVAITDNQAVGIDGIWLNYQIGDE